MAQYKGMRWLKCDLQMQTPADAQHWMGDAMVAGQEPVAARAFAEACHSADLDVVGITDHNFLSRDFIPHLRNAFDEIRSEHGHAITLFPGFEFEAAGVGRGVHVLCLFEPNSDLATLDSILTECGVRYPRVDASGRLEKSDKNLKDILTIVQQKHGGIVIFPHALSNDGLFDNDSVSQWLQKDQFINPELLAVEVPKPVARMSNAFQKLFRSGDDCHQDWKRIRPIATLMSSDNKKLIESDSNGRPVANSIGYRYSWIKMSQPSIESLRQAFLDHESRIRLPEDVATDLNPGKRHRQVTIRSLTVRGAAFLADQNIAFSPNMNSVIGGRGSGKSSLLEYLRIVCGHVDDPDIDDGTRQRIDRIQSTLQEDGSTLELVWESADGVEDVLAWENGELRVNGHGDFRRP